MTRGGRVLPGVVALVTLSAGLVLGIDRLLEAPRHPSHAALAPVHEPHPTLLPGRDGQEHTDSFPIPSGRAASLTCQEARKIVRQIRATLPYEPVPVAPLAFATSTTDWLDPYGLWSETPDSPVPGILEAEAPGLLRELEDTDPASCSAGHAVAVALAGWTHELGLTFEAAHSAALVRPPPDRAAIEEAASLPAFEDDSAGGAEVAGALGTRLGTVERGLGDEIASYDSTARARLFTDMPPEGWGDVIRAAALRAYVGLVDPHGAWAPVDEEASVFDVDLDAVPPDNLWDEGTRTALGVRVDARPLAPLEVGDVVLSVAGVPLVGLPPEQLSQLVYATTDADTETPIVVLRKGESATRTLMLPPAPSGEGSRDANEPATPLTSYRVPYGDGEALVVEVHEVRADLGDELRLALDVERARTVAGAPRIAGLLLDLRANGGGATDGAISALGLFLPGARLFPMEHRDGTIEVDRAPLPPEGERWGEPVAALVDRDTASAGEMIAGALQAYHRGPVVGERTYGKGCAQESVEDDAGVGVLKLTTLLYALPDGTPVQQVGLEPSLLLPALASLDGRPSPRQREADERNAPPTWRGPDVRDPTMVTASERIVWQDPHGHVGPTVDPVVTAALRGVGTRGSRFAGLARARDPLTAK